MVVGCFDWDPLAAAFHPHLMMVRQSVEVMIARVFEMIDAPVVEKNRCIEVAPEIIGV